MKKNKKLTKEDVVNIIKMRKNGETLKSIAVKYNVSETHIGKIMDGKKLTKWTKGLLPEIVDSRFKLSDEAVQEIIALRKNQISQRIIADKFKISQSMVSKICLAGVRKNIVEKQTFTFICKHCDQKFVKQYNVQEFCSPHCRLWYNIDKKPFQLFKSPCYSWKLDKDKDGYGKISWKKDNGKIGNVSVCRLLLEEKLGRKIKPGMQACHTCDNPSCCNPKHLYEGTPKRNKQDSIDRDRHAYGEKIGVSKLREPEVVFIVDQLKQGVKYDKLAKYFNVSESSIHNIFTNKYWKHIPR